MPRRESEPSTNPETKRCEQCNGTGKVDGKECPVCHGSGSIVYWEDKRR